ncbi:hypothetical protein NCS57_01422000 [Fusarium keratoplasticum]|uniref:Uncharacterized protein n=1 Tax=Fusarium keratoplasticum TaxID=1328300 RepID=A0ACC0QG81_9HYPO|nr:hypothetical protein NCS57_01422000 [Fusarium keratoplasticum]KAI8650869.1 hypothetical protein NCS57_01422000 [Fusarium keratoplasticum]
MLTVGRNHHWTLTGRPLDAQEPGQDEVDTGLALDDNASSTASLASTILEYRMLNGRRYDSERGNAQYWVSNDEQSNAALDINHHVITPIYGGKLDFADGFPSTKVIGTNISAIQPSWTPPNLEFQIDDCTQE